MPSILELIPHRAPMLLIDALLEADEYGAFCSFTVDAQTGSLRQGELPAMYAVEAMAQAVAAHLGALALWRGEPSSGGYLIGVRDVVLGRAAFVPGDALVIEVRHAFGSDRLASYTCQVRLDATDVASATLNVLRKPA